MRKVNALLTAMLIAAGGMTASAATMGPAITTGESYSMLDGSYVTYSGDMVLSWGETVSFTSDNPSFTFYKEGDSPETMTSIKLGGPYEYGNPESAAVVTLSFGYLYNSGKYYVNLPAGVVKNAQGDTNPAQTFTFTIVSGSIYSSEMTFTPALSESSYDYDIGGYTAAPFYSAEDLSDVTISFQSTVTNVSMGTGKLTGYINYYDQKDFTDKVTVRDNKVHIDFSSLEPGTWEFTLPQGFLVFETTDGIKTNQTCYLKYTVQGEVGPLGEPTVSYPRPGAHYLTSLSYIEMSFGQPVMMKDNAPAVTASVNGQTINLIPTVSSDYSGNYTFKVRFEEEATTPGLYTITIPAGVLSNNVYDNEVITMQYYVVNYTENMTVTPENKASLSAADFGTITITYPDATKIEANEYNFEPISVRGGSYGNYKYNYNLTMDNGVSIDGNKIILTIPEVNQVDYWVSIYGVNFIIDDNYANDYINLEYSVWDGMQPGTAIEAPGYELTVVPDNAKVLLTWDYQDITATEDFGVELVMSYDDVEVPETALNIVEVDNPEGGKGMALLVDLSDVTYEYIANSSHYGHTVNLTIPAGIIQNGEGLLNPMQTFKFDVYEESPEPLFMVPSTDDEGIYYVTVEDCSWMSTPTYGVDIDLVDVKGNVISIKQSSSYSDPAPGEYLKNSVEVNGESTPALIINLSEVPDGRYTMTIPEGLVKFNIRSIGSFPDYTNIETEFPFVIGTPVAEAVLLSAEADNVDIISADIVVEYGFYEVPEGGSTQIIATEYESRVDIVKDVDADSKEFTIPLTGLQPATEYTYMVVAQILDAEGQIVTRSTPIEVKFTTMSETDGIINIDADGEARYFTIDGVQVTNPQPGSLYIKVQGNKATKVIVR